MSLESKNPATDELLQTYTEMNNQEVDEIINCVEDDFHTWHKTSFTDRAKLMRSAATLLKMKKKELANLMTQEMGKPIAGAITEVEKCAFVCEYYADNAENFLAPEIIQTDASISKVLYQPLGIVLAVMPWNFPLWQVFRFAAPALMAGNAALLKHASNVCGSALAIENIFCEAGFPADIFRTLLIGSTKVARVIENPLVKAVTLTGSTPAGRAVAAKAGKMLKKTVLELGGSDPYIVLADADIEHAVQNCVTSRLINSGQSCIAAKRFIVEKSVSKSFTEKFVANMKSKRCGDPLDETTEIGPQARKDLRDDLHKQVQSSLDKGARLLLGGKVPEGPGAYYPATVLADVVPGMPAYDEELFGPVAAIITAEDEDEAIRIANDTVFGLGAAVFTANHKHGEKIASEQLNAGACFVNCLVKSDPRLPFGGIGDSGYGRELGHHGIKEFVNIKTVYVA